MIWIDNNENVLPAISSIQTTNCNYNCTISSSLSVKQTMIQKDNNQNVLPAISSIWTTSTKAEK